MTPPMGFLAIMSRVCFFWLLAFSTSWQSALSWSYNIRWGLPISQMRRGQLCPLAADAKTTEPANPPLPAAHSIYSKPALYDMAFGYRGYEEEVEFLVKAHFSMTGRLPKNILELAAGPGRHSIEALKNEDSIQSATWIDLSQEMADYSLQLAAEELDEERLACLDYRIDDMRTFKTSKKYDSAWILLGSLQHLTNNDDVIQCLQSVSAALTKEGTVVIELPHPRETFTMVECTRNGWEIPLEDETGGESGELKIIWGDEDDPFDPITQVRQFTVDMKVTGTNQTEELPSVRAVVPMRLFTAQEIDIFARLAGFSVDAMYGSLDEDVSVDNEDLAFRLVCVLRKQ